MAQTETQRSGTFTKSCSNPNCKQQNPQPIDNFWKRKAAKDGRMPICISCRKDYLVTLKGKGATVVSSEVAVSNAQTTDTPCKHFRICEPDDIIAQKFPGFFEINRHAERGQQWQVCKECGDAKLVQRFKNLADPDEGYGSFNRQDIPIAQSDGKAHPYRRYPEMNPQPEQTEQTQIGNEHVHAVVQDEQLIASLTSPLPSRPAQSQHIPPYVNPEDLADTPAQEREDVTPETEWEPTVPDTEKVLVGHYSNYPPTPIYAELPVQARQPTNVAPQIPFDQQLVQTIAAQRAAIDAADRVNERQEAELRKERLENRLLKDDIAELQLDLKYARLELENYQLKEELRTLRQQHDYATGAAALPTPNNSAPSLQVGS